MAGAVDSGERIEIISAPNVMRECSVEKVGDGSEVVVLRGILYYEEDTIALMICLEWDNRRWEEEGMAARRFFPWLLLGADFGYDPS